MLGLDLQLQQLNEDYKNLLKSIESIESIDIKTCSTKKDKIILEKITEADELITELTDTDTSNIDSDPDLQMDIRFSLSNINQLITEITTLCNGEQDIVSKKPNRNEFFRGTETHNRDDDEHQHSSQSSSPHL